MKLAISNIAWDNADLDNLIPLITMQGVSGIEVAPTKIWQDPISTSTDSLAVFRAKLEHHKLYIPSTQAILFNHPELMIFYDIDTRDRTLNYIKEMIRVSAMLGAKAIVFGSPKNRVINKISYTRAIEIAKDFFTEIGNSCKSYGVYFCLEPNAKEYGADFLVTTHETINFLELLNHPNVKLNLDSGNMIMNGENVEESIQLAASFLYHFQISEPNLAPINPLSKYHRSISKALHAIQYSNWLSIEMRPVDIETLNKSIIVVKKYYEL